MKYITSALLAWLLPVMTLAQGLVPCGQKNADGTIVECGFCEMGQLIDNVADWFVAVGGILVVLIIIGGGLMLVVSTGNVSAKVTARRFISTGLVGYMILLGAWVIVDTFLKFMIPGSSYGVNNPLIC